MLLLFLNIQITLFPFVTFLFTSVTLAPWFISLLSLLLVILGFAVLWDFLCRVHIKFTTHIYDKSLNQYSEKFWVGFYNPDTTPYSARGAGRQWVGYGAWAWQSPARRHTPKHKHSSPEPIKNDYNNIHDICQQYEFILFSLMNLPYYEITHIFGNLMKYD